MQNVLYLGVHGIFFDHNPFNRNSGTATDGNVTPESVVLTTLIARNDILSNHWQISDSSLVFLSSCMQSFHKTQAHHDEALESWAFWC